LESEEIDMPTIQKVLIYLDDANNFPREVPFSSFQGSTGITAANGSTIIPQIKTADNLTVRMVNFAPPPTAPGSKFGSILGICYVWSDGVKSWVKEIVHEGPNASNLDVAIGNWVEGKTYEEAKNDPRYRKPYIGYATASDYAEYRIEDYVAPEPPPPPPDPEPITVNIVEDIIRLKKDDTTTLHGEITSEAPIVAAEWQMDASIIQKSISQSQAVLQFPVPGEYTIKLWAKNGDDQTGEDTATVIVRDLYGIAVAILEDNQQIAKGNSLQLHAVVESEGTIIAQNWVIPSGVDIQSQAGTNAILTFNRIGTYEIRFGARNEDGLEAYDSIVITVVDPPKKEIGQSLFLDIDGNLIPVDPTVTLNDHTVNKDNIKLRFRNSGESTWLNESFTVEVGKESFKFTDGTTQHIGNLTRVPGADYVLTGLIQDFQETSKYTIVIKCFVQDDEGQTNIQFYQLKWFGQARAEYPLEIYNPKRDVHKYPNIMKRNARYRGHRESEKVLSDHQEQIFDIRQLYVDIKSLTDLQDTLTKSWFLGENEAPVENITLAQTKTFTANIDQTAYPLNPGTPASQYAGVVVQLNGADIAPNQYHIDNGYLIINSKALQNGSLTVSYTVTISVEEQKMIGTYDLKARMQQMDERLGELERRYRRHENAYE
jgi:hypothetical protein